MSSYNTLKRILSSTLWQYQQWRQHRKEQSFQIDSGLPVFVVGCQRSGTNMLVRHLARSSDIILYNEDHPEIFQDFHIVNLTVVENTLNSNGVRVSLFKPILDTSRAHDFLGHFPSARVLFIFRHFDDVTNSLLRAFDTDPAQRIRKWFEGGCLQHSRFRADPNYPTEATYLYLRRLYRSDLDDISCTALYWFIFSQFFFSLQLHQHPRVLGVCYETLVRNPRLGFKQICSFLGIKYSRQMSRGVQASSIGKEPAREIDHSIRAECLALYDHLVAAVSGAASSSFSL